MNKFDTMIKEKAKEETREVPENVKAKIEDTLFALPEREKKTKSWVLLQKTAVCAVCVMILFLVVLPNFNSTYAQVLENIPVIGDFVKVVTIRNYFYSDKKHEMNIEVPKIENENNIADSINKEVDELTKILADKFQEELESLGEGYHSIYSDYEIVTNTEEWFTLKIYVLEIAGSSNTYYKYYHIDKNNNKIVNLSDLSEDENFYAVLEEEIKRQLHERMRLDPNEVYWVDEDTEQDCVQLDESHNFYWKENGDIVIVFDKYEIAPGFMGTPEVVIERKVFNDMLTEK